MTDNAYAATHCLVTTSTNENYNILSTLNANNAATASRRCCFDRVIWFGDEQISSILKEHLPKNYNKWKRNGNRLANSSTYRVPDVGTCSTESTPIKQSRMYISSRLNNSPNGRSIRLFRPPIQRPPLNT